MQYDINIICAYTHVETYKKYLCFQTIKELFSKHMHLIFD